MAVRPTRILTAWLCLGVLYKLLILWIFSLNESRCGLQVVGFFKIIGIIELLLHLGHGSENKEKTPLKIRFLLIINRKCDINDAQMSTNHSTANSSCDY